MTPLFFPNITDAPSEPNATSFDLKSSHSVIVAMEKSSEKKNLSRQSGLVTLKSTGPPAISGRRGRAGEC